MTKTIEIHFEAWTCSACKHDNRAIPEETDICRGCGKEYTEEDGGYDASEKFEMPSTWVVCGDCQGSGTTYLGWASKDQPAFTAEDMAYEGPDFQEDYMSGRYDKQCPGCKGRTTISEIDEKAVKGELKEIFEYYVKQQQCRYEFDEIAAMERRMGA